uniref:Carboxylic ester hydrolase n=1 Tax=Strigamia maritima TaxID=126957 RepID=T1J8Q3_STRMM
MKLAHNELTVSLISAIVCFTCLVATANNDHLYEDDDDDGMLQVATTSGAVRGMRRHVLGEELHVFLGIPFGKPPVGEYRFRRPEPIPPWEGIYEATRLPNSCMQDKNEYFPGFRGEEMWNPNTNLSEDCLYLNVWVPARVRRQRDTPASVMIWIYGGSYMSGTSTLQLYDGSILATMNGVIVASINYRVGVFGFLYFGTDDAPGNAGLYDQKLALEWLNANVRSFGGNPESMTIFGESAGSGSVTVHLLSPATRHLVTRGIMQSGTVNAPWSFMTAETALTRSLALANLLGCNTMDKERSTVLACLLDMPATTLSNGQWSLYASILTFPFCPTVDGYFLTKSPQELLRDGDFKRENILLGSNLNEGTYFILYDFMNYFDKDGPSLLKREEMMEMVGSIFRSFSQIEKEAVGFQYTDWEAPSDGRVNRDSVGDMVGDYFFVCPMNHFAQAYAAQGVNVYYYYFTHRTSVSPWGAWMGVMHGDEIEYVFGRPLNRSLNFTQAERELSQRIMNYFANFAKTG